MRGYFSKKYIYALSGSLLVTLGLLLFILVLPRSGVAEDTNSVVGILNLVENQTLSQNYTFKFESISNLDFVELHFIRLDKSDMLNKMAVAQRIDATSNIWFYTLDLSLLGSGSYRLETIAIFSDGTEVAGQTRNFYIVQSAPVPDLMTTPDLIKIFSPSHQAIVAGDIVLQAESSQPVTEIFFSVFNKVGILEKQIVSSVSVAQTTHTVHFDSTTLSGDGLYTLKVQADISDRVLSAEPIIFYLVNNFNQNVTSTPVSLSFTSPINSKEISGKFLIQVRSNVEIDSLYFRFGKNLVTARKYDNNLWQEYVITTNYPNGEYELLAIASNQGREYYTPVIRVKVINTTSTITTTEAPPPTGKINPILPPLINQISVNNPVTSNNLLPVDNLLLKPPPTTTIITTTETESVECLNENIKNITCQVYLRNRNNFSNECIAKVLDIEECLNSYEKCKSSGVMNIDACFKYLSEPRASRWCDLAEFKNEPLCIEYNSQRLLPQTTSNLDARCLDQGIINQTICNKYLEFINLPQECQKQKIITRKECNQFLESNFISTACQILGLTDRLVCEQQILEKYQNQKMCTGENCQVLLKDFLPEMAAREVSKQVLARARLKLANDFLNIENRDDTDVKPLISRLPVQFDGDNNYKILTTDDRVDFTDGQVTSPLPMALVKDTDQDGLPNDMERRLGTMVDNPDTDSDGYLDGEEVRNGYDPLLPAARLTTNLAPVEIALINGVTFEHASLAGSETSDLQISEIINSSDVENNNLILNGIGPAFSVVTLYIYSDIPLIATVQVDEYGRWQYILTDKMVDGEHQVYVAINDETGKVEKKSIGKIFFVNQARAATVNDYINLTITEETKVLEKYYLFGTVGLVLFAIVVFLLLHFRRRSEQNIFPS